SAAPCCSVAPPKNPRARRSSRRLGEWGELRLAMEIVRAAPELAESLTRIALAAKRYWRYPERWIEIWTPILTFTPEYVAANPTYVAVEDGSPVGFYALVVAQDGSRAQLDHLWI